MNNEELAGQLKSQSTWRLFFLTIITLGIYSAHYIYRQTKIMNHSLNGGHKISEDLVKFIFVFSYVTAIITIPYLFAPEGHSIETLYDLLDLIWGILIVIWAFKARNRMNMLLSAVKGQPHWFHGLWTFLFTNLYFNFKINKLNEMKNSKE
ncbi:MAG TPA: DUF4234 domain-containing protein [Nitrospirae bacterium]|nr:hypothetical protein BMS3Abin10_00106 [bacterium BMS3Abin10]HDH01291.1 DUF4234 domain-containing protein [Nitrospirota bacterium]